MIELGLENNHTTLIPKKKIMEMFGISRPTFHRWTKKDNPLQVTKILGKTYVLRENLDEFIKSNTV
tara:strand:+ start:471 stop:668 length:198 start_codon:yes stop_codon:yes gene_type:complete